MDERTSPGAPGSGGEVKTPWRTGSGHGFGVEATGLMREFPTQLALAGVDLAVEPGAMVAVMGPSG
ncbi:MAG: hypothetical protein ACRDZY_05275, partial [Acidimicrobiales bacterium]